MAEIPPMRIHVDIDKDSIARLANMVREANVALDGCADATRSAREAVRELAAEISGLRRLTAPADEEGYDGR